VTRHVSFDGRTLIALDRIGQGASVDVCFE
jgi:hypothetical protein